jgi:hypothetical protein
MRKIEGTSLFADADPCASATNRLVGPSRISIRKSETPSTGCDAEPVNIIGVLRVAYTTPSSETTPEVTVPFAPGTNKETFMLALVPAGGADGRISSF